ncbi:MAG TPA: hydroxymethylglutaryl-CoA reductase, partial [Bacteroidia bacterium]
NKLLPDEPEPFKNATMEGAIAELQKEIDDFFSVYAANTGLRVVNPFFGNLNYEEQVRLLYKHTTHHARQFGLL